MSFEILISWAIEKWSEVLLYVIWNPRKQQNHSVDSFTGHPVIEAGPVFVHNTKSDNDNQRHHLPLCQVQVNSALPRSSIQVVWEVAVRGAVLQVTKSPPSPLIHYSQT